MHKHAWAFQLELSMKSHVFSTQLKLKLKIQLSYHYLSWWVGRWVEKKTKLMLYSTQLQFKLKFELNLAILKINSIYIIKLCMGYNGRGCIQHEMNFVSKAMAYHSPGISQRWHNIMLAQHSTVIAQRCHSIALAQHSSSQNIYSTFILQP